MSNKRIFDIPSVPPTSKMKIPVDDGEDKAKTVTVKDLVNYTKPTRADAIKALGEEVFLSLFWQDTITDEERKNPSTIKI